MRALVGICAIVWALIYLAKGAVMMWPLAMGSVSVWGRPITGWRGRAICLLAYPFEVVLWLPLLTLGLVKLKEEP